jgi:hypothetical protein
LSRYSSKKKRRRKKLPKKSIGIESSGGRRTIDCRMIIAGRSLPLRVFIRLEFNKEKSTRGRR